MNIVCHGVPQIATCTHMHTGNYEPKNSGTRNSGKHRSKSKLSVCQSSLSSRAQHDPDHGASMPLHAVIAHSISDPKLALIISFDVQRSSRDFLELAHRSVESGGRGASRCMLAGGVADLFCTVRSLEGITSDFLRNGTCV